MIDPHITVPSLAAKAPAVADQAVRHGSSLSEHASSILEGLRVLAENPGISIEEMGIGIAAVASVAATMRSIQEFRKDRSEDRVKREALMASNQWAAADGSLIAYATNRGHDFATALGSATAEINRFMPRSDPRAQCIDIAMKMPVEDRLESAGGFDKALSVFSKVMPGDAGVSHNHAKLAALATSPLEAAAVAERAAFGAVDRGEANTARSRQASFRLLQAAASRAVALERGELVLALEAPGRPPKRDNEAAR